MRIFNKYLLLPVLLSAAAISGCASQVKPWEKDLLAQAHMAIEPDSQQRTIDEQIVTSKEGSSGGFGVVGGGCGCN